MKRLRRRASIACLLFAAAFAVPAAAVAQDRSGGFLDNLFNRGGDEQSQQQQQQQQQSAPPPRAVAQADNADVAARIDRIENALRQLTGTIEQLQHDNQVLQMQLKRMQDDTEYRFQQLGSRGPAPAGAPAAAPVPAAPGGPAAGQRGDAFDPRRNPNAPGAPRPLASEAQPAVATQPGVPGPIVTNEPPVGAPGSREAGAPLDLNSLAGTVSSAPAAPAGPAVAGAPPQGGQLPPPPSRNTSATGAALATLPPSAKPQDEYDMAYGYVLHKDYGLAVQAFGDFLRKYPNERLVPDAHYWLGESLYQQQHYSDAAKSFLTVATKYEHAGKAPDALLRLGQSLAALHKKEAACATLNEVNRKYPRASASVKRGVTQELKRAHC